jgi:RimJ/RimL family protein N-acetyltransferase
MDGAMDLRNLLLTSARLRLAAFQPADAPEVFAAVTPRVTRFMSFDPEPSLDAFAAVWRGWLPKMAAGSELFLVLRLGESGEFLGVGGLHELGAAEPIAGLWLKEAAQRQGYGPEAVAAMIEWAAGVTGARAVLARSRGESAQSPPRRGPGRLGHRHEALAQRRDRASRGDLPHPRSAVTERLPDFRAARGRLPLTGWGGVHIIRAPKRGGWR